MHAKFWQFLVLDEVHSYNGAKGIEIAMLLRRLKDRVVKNEPGRLRCIATSATLGRGKSDYIGVANFANNLFGETFDETDIIGATREPLILNNNTWGQPKLDLYLEWQGIVNSKSTPDQKVAELINSGKTAEVPTEVLTAAYNAYHENNNIHTFLYYALKGNRHLIDLQKMLTKKPHYLSEVAGQIFSENEIGVSVNLEQTAVALVDLSVKARFGEDDQALLPARYHVFVKSIEGAFMSIDSEQELLLTRYEKIKRGQKEIQVSEVAVCRGCGAFYLVGEIDDKADGKYFVQPKEERSDLKYFLMANTKVISQLDEDEESEDYENGAREIYGLELYKLCSQCGKLDKHNVLLFNCACEEADIKEVYFVPAKSGKVATCHVCGRFSPHGIIKRFAVGTDAAASVLTTSLYQQIEPKVATFNCPSEDSDFDNEWGSASYEGQVENNNLEKSGRKLLIFSDSRQDAAFFAPYFNRTYMQILRRNLIISALQDNKVDVLDNQWRLQDLVKPLVKQVNDLKIFKGMSWQEQINEVWKWLIYELIGYDRRLGLEGLGLLGFSLVKPACWSAPQPLMQSPWNLSADEIWVLMQILLDSIRFKGAVLFPEYISPTDDFFQPRNRELHVRGRQANLKKGILSWNSTGGRLNARFDFLSRLAAAIDEDIDSEQCRIVLGRIWDKVLALDSQESCWQEYFSSESIMNEGLTYRLRHNMWALQPSVINDHIKWYRCDKCQDLTMHNLKGICPSYRCDGTLKSCLPNQVLAGNHYRKLYIETLPLMAKAEEHTAQLTSTAAAKLQNSFIKGDVNILSCSTTFELGVDVGELEAVLMRNVPPSAANYIQRAGRAGRRTDSTAFTLTFAQRRSHDLNHYAEPWRMVAGKVGVPHLAITNEKIVRRHLFAVVLAEFWKLNPDYYGSVDKFFLQESEGSILLDEYLMSKPSQLKEALKRVVPDELHEILEIETWGWKDKLTGFEDGLLVKANEEINQDIEQLEAVKETLMAEQKPSDSVLRLIKTLKRKPLIDFLSSRSIIPKYGFPVDVVELQISHHSEAAHSLKLDRDLRIALSEYAPSSEVVAGGRLWTSRYIRRSPRYRGTGEWEWERIRYAICENCNNYNRQRAEYASELTHCERCKNILTGKNKGQFIIPAFGFIAERAAPKVPGEQRPEKTYSTRVYFSGAANRKPDISLTLNGTILKAMPANHGKMALINSAGFRQFRVCSSCGFSIIGGEAKSESHPKPWGGECRGTLRATALGHEFETDILQLTFTNYKNENLGFWYSLLYTLLEGCSEALDIERQDLDGVLYPITGDLSMPALVLFDDVPGGAGHTHRIAKADILKQMLHTSLTRLNRCECGGIEAEASCYGCLRHYRNQFCHTQLNRRIVIDFLEGILDQQ